MTLRLHAIVPPGASCLITARRLTHAAASTRGSCALCTVTPTRPPSALPMPPGSPTLTRPPPPCASGLVTHNTLSMPLCTCRPQAETLIYTAGSYTGSVYLQCVCLTPICIVIPSHSSLKVCASEWVQSVWLLGGGCFTQRKSCLRLRFGFPGAKLRAKRPTKRTAPCSCCFNRATGANGLPLEERVCQRTSRRSKLQCGWKRSPLQASV